MGYKDIITKDILKSIAKELSKYILKIDVAYDIELIDKEFTRVEKREADLLFKNGNEIIHIEIQNANHKDMHKRMLRYYSDILFDYEEYPIKQYLIYIGREKCSMNSTIKRDKIEYNYAIIDMKNIPCEEFLQSSDPSAVALSILCDFEGRDKQLIVNTILKRLKELSSDELEFRSKLRVVEILSTNRDLEQEVQKGEEMLKVDIEKMPSYNIGLERGMQKGIEKGIKKGIEEGMQKSAMLIAKKMIELGMPIEDIVNITNLSKKVIEELKNNN